MLSTQNEKVLKTFFRIQLINNDSNKKNNNDQDKRKIVSKRLEEMNLVRADLVKI